MEINIKVTIELPEWAEALVKQLANNGAVKVNSPAPAAEQPAAPAAEQPAAPAAPAKPAKPAAPAKPAEKPAEQPAPKPKLGLGGKAKPAAPAKPAEQPAEEAPAEEESTHTLDELRELLKEKYEGNAATIKAKLTDFKAASLSKLDPECYDAMYDFLADL